MSDANDPVQQAGDAAQAGASSGEGAPVINGDAAGQTKQKPRTLQLILLGVLVALLVGTAVDPDACSKRLASVLYHFGLVDPTYLSEDDESKGPLILPPDTPTGAGAGAPPSLPELPSNLTKKKASNGAN